MAEAVKELKTRLQERIGRLELRNEAEEKLASGEWEITKIAAGGDGALKVTLDRGDAGEEDPPELILPKDGSILPAGLANAVRQPALRANADQGWDGFDANPYGPGLELTAPDDRTVRAVTHVRTHPDAVISARATVRPTATIDAQATIGSRAEVRRFAHVAPWANVERLAIVGPGTHVPPGSPFLENPAGQARERQQQWMREGARAVEEIDGRAADRADAAGLYDPPERTMAKRERNRGTAVAGEEPLAQQATPVIRGSDAPAGGGASELQREHGGQAR